MHKHKVMTLAAAGCLAVCTAALAQNNMGAQGNNQMGSQTNQMGSQTNQMGSQTNSQMGSQGDSQQEKKFVSTASEGGLAEVEMGKLASDKAKNPAVKAFAEKMVQDHTMLNDKMKPVAESMGVTPADHMSLSDDAEYAKLKVLTGDDFDKAYMSEMVKDHQADLAQFKQEEVMASNPQLKHTVMAGEKVIAMHAKMANKVAQQIGVSTSTSTSSM